MIANILEKIKVWFKENEKDIVLAVGVFLIAVISFGLGILSQKEQIPVVIEDSDCATSSAASASNNLAGVFVASQKGSYYHLPQCPSARNISEANKIWFQTKAEAEAMGYKPASNCPGL